MAKDKLRVYYHDPNSILVVNPKGQIRKLYTPFRVLCANSVENRLKKGTWVFVDEVRSGKNDILIFMIGGYPFQHQYFQIQINF